MILFLRMAAAGESASAALTRILEDFRLAVRVSFIGGGTPALTSALTRLAAALEVAPLVALYGAQQPAQVVQFMQQADVLVNPRVSGTYYIAAVTAVTAARCCCECSICSL